VQDDCAGEEIMKPSPAIVGEHREESRKRGRDGEAEAD
jgi:hypothetical protein